MCRPCAPSTSWVVRRPSTPFSGTWVSPLSTGRPPSTVSGSRSAMPRSASSNSPTPMPPSPVSVASGPPLSFAGVPSAPPPDSPSPRAVACPQAVYLIADILSDNDARSPAFGSRSPLRLPFRCAVKTGTSSDFRDNWCLGFTADFTVGVWVGNFDNAPMRGVSGVSGAGPIFHRVMRALHRDRPPRWLPDPGGLARITIDSRTGHRFPGEVPPGHPFATSELCLANRLPLPVHPDDYDERGRALIDRGFHQWFESADNTRRTTWPFPGRSRRPSLPRSSHPCPPPPISSIPNSPAAAAS